LAFSSILATYILTTYGWFVALTSLSRRNTISFTDSIAIVNTSNLTKYIPGKIWSYALQAYWLAKAGFSNSLILFVYILNVFTIIMVSLMSGLCYLIVAPGAFPRMLLIACLILLVLFDILFVRFNSTLFNALISAIGKKMKREIIYYEAPTKLLLRLHSIHIISAASFGIGAYFLCLGIGFNIPKDSVFLVMSSMILSDTIGFLSFIVPGGLGVREGVMYLLLKGDAFGSLSLILPVATRIVMIVVDVVLGAIGFILLNQKKKSESGCYGKQA
jgi:hypothetical protein